MRNLKQLFMFCLLWTMGIVANAEKIPNDEIWYEAIEALNLKTNVFNTSVFSHTFISGKGIIKFSGNVTSIGDFAFYNCSGLTSITIPNSVTSIGTSAFSNCSGLTSITIPNSVTSIGNSAFNGCSGLKSVIIGKSVTSIGFYPFYGCSGLTSIQVDSDNHYYDSREECNAIISTTDNTLITGCMNTVIPNSVTSIGACAFSNCTGLTSIIIPNSVTSIGGSAFDGCTSLTSVSIGKSVTSIDGTAFSGCLGLTSLKVQWSRPLSISSNVLSSVNKTKCTLYVPKGTAQMYMVAPTWIDFVNIVEYGGLVESISLNKSEITLIKGDNVTLTATVQPDDAEDKSLTWESSNPNVATVVDGVVTGVSAGNATITATTNDGSELSASCEVTVVASNYVVIDKSGKTINKNIEQYDDIVIKDEYVSVGIYEEVTDVNVIYSRTFKNTNWQPLYVPFDLDVTSELLSNFSFAKYAGTYTEDDGTFCITIAKLNEGSKIKANTPYFIKAKVADSSNPQTISVAGTTLHATAETENYMLSAEKKVSIFGIYNKKTFTAEEVAEKNVYGYGGGTYNPQTAGQTLGAFRFYIKLTNREDNMYGTDTPSSIKLKVLGDEDDATSIDALQTSTESDANIYDLSGRAVSNPKHGVYIKNGKKYYVK